jgi:hypothetical protein
MKKKNSDSHNGSARAFILRAALLFEGEFFFYNIEQFQFDPCTG